MGKRNPNLDRYRVTFCDIYGNDHEEEIQLGPRENLTYAVLAKHLPNQILSECDTVTIHVVATDPELYKAMATGDF